MQLPFSDSPGHVRLGTNTDTKQTNCSPRRTKMLSKQHIWYAFRRTVFVHGVGAQRCSGSRARDAEAGRRRVGCGRHYSIERQTRHSTSPPGWRTSNSPEDESTRVADIKHCSRAFTQPKQRERVSAFTLIELLIVMAIIGILLLLIAPAFTTIKGGTDVTSAAYMIKGVLDTARTYAMANNTYTWVGFAGSVGPNTQQYITGQVEVAIVASKDGTNLWSANNSLPAASLAQVGKMMSLGNIHIGDTGVPQNNGTEFESRGTVDSDHRISDRFQGKFLIFSHLEFVAPTPGINKGGNRLRGGGHLFLHQGDLHLGLRMFQKQL
jgi:prepilin-type N-terminal cleavage/methylation domain-containing protein